MTAKQSYAIYCKTGVDVRRCNLDNNIISFIFDNPFTVSREYLLNIPGTSKRGIPDYHGKWLKKEYELLLEYCLKQSKMAYSELSGSTGYYIIHFKCSNGFSRYIRKIYPDKTGCKIIVKNGVSLMGNNDSCNKLIELFEEHGIYITHKISKPLYGNFRTD